MARCCPRGAWTSTCSGGAPTRSCRRPSRRGPPGRQGGARAARRGCLRPPRALPPAHRAPRASRAACLPGGAPSASLCRHTCLFSDSCAVGEAADGLAALTEASVPDGWTMLLCVDRVHVAFLFPPLLRSTQWWWRASEAAPVQPSPSPYAQPASGCDMTPNERDWASNATVLGLG